MTPICRSAARAARSTAPARSPNSRSKPPRPPRPTRRKSSNSPRPPPISICPRASYRRPTSTRAASAASPARSNTPSTATTRRPGGSTPAPAAATSRARPSFALEQPIANAGGTVLTIYLSQKHGGWNSDDNQNNNLGRIRLSITTSPNAKADPLPAEVREILSIDADQRTPEQVRKVFSYWRTTVPEWKEANARSRSSGSSIRRARRSSCSTNASSRARRTFSSAAIFSSRRRKSRPAFRRSCTPLPENAPRESPDLRPLAGRSQIADHRPFDRQPRLAGLFRHRHRRHHRRLRDAQLAAVASRTARLARRRVHGPRLEPQAPSPPDRDFGDLPAIVASDAGNARARPYNRLLARGPRFRVDAEIVRDIALAASGLLNPASAARASFRPRPISCSSRR